MPSHSHIPSRHESIANATDPIDAAFERAMHNRSNQAATDTDQQRITEAVRKFFDPVFDVFQRLDSQNIKFSLNERYSLPSSLALMLRSKRLPAPGVFIQVSPSEEIVISVAVRDLPYPDNILTARWRCRLISNGHDVENVLIDNKITLAEWVFRVVLSFDARNRATHAATSPATEQPLPSQLGSIPSREQRSIDLRD